MRGLSSRAQTVAQRIVFPEGEDPRILKAARILADDGVAEPILLGDPDAIRREADDAGVTLEEITLANPRASVHLETFAQELWEDRKSTRLNSSHGYISYAVFCLKKKNKKMCNTCSVARAQSS